MLIANVDKVDALSCYICSNQQPMALGVGHPISIKYVLFTGQVLSIIIIKYYLYYLVQCYYCYNNNHVKLSS